MFSLYVMNACTSCSVASLKETDVSCRCFADGSGDEQMELI